MPYANLSVTDVYDSLLSTTLRNYRSNLEDNIFRELPLLYWLNSKGRKKTIDGGYEIIIPVLYGTNSATRIYDGYDLLDTTPQEGITSLRYPWKQMATPITISRKEERQNSGAKRMISLLETKIQQAEKSMKWVLNDLLHGRHGAGFAGSGSGVTYCDTTSDYDSAGQAATQSSTGFNSLDNFVRMAQGMAIPTATTTVTHTVGGLAVKHAWSTQPGATYTDLTGGTTNQASSQNAWWANLCMPGWQRTTRGGLWGTPTTATENAYVGQITDASNQNLITAMRTMYNRLSDGGDHPDLGLTSQDVYEIYEGALMPLERFQDTKLGDAGFSNLRFKGMTLMYDSGILTPLPSTPTAAAPAVPLYMLNSQYIDWTVDSQTDFYTTPFQRPENQDARVAHILLMANLTCSNRQKQGVMACATGTSYAA